MLGMTGQNLLKEMVKFIKGINLKGERGVKSYR